MICILDDDKDYPHFSLRSYTFEGKRYHSLCLFESGTIIEYIHTPAEKIKLCIEKLITLTSLTQKEIVFEYQKEFLLYWEKACNSNKEKYSKGFQLYLTNPDQYCWMEQHEYPNKKVRIVETGHCFNDENKRVFVNEIPALYIPLIDTTNIIPPLPNKPWDGSHINQIINGLDFQHISSEAYKEIVTISYSRKEILLLFKLNDLFFACFVVFKHAGTAKLHIKLESQIQEVIPIVVKRCDYQYLNERIGNAIFKDRIVIVGAGSLGSYIATELIYAGYRDITIVDDDVYEYENTFRYAANYFGNGLPKVELLKFELESIHPEIRITAIKEYLSINNFNTNNLLSSDAIIFTVGSSDVQLKLNKYLCQRKVSIPVYYAWLEPDGKTSHVVAIRDYHQGCFECLFTNQEGNLCANILNTSMDTPKMIIRNGCGGTRVPYGNLTLLTATTALITALKDDSNENKVYSFFNNQITEKEFPRNERCNCCGIQK